MISDEELYRQYISGDETGLDELMKKYGDPLTLYINGYLHDVHEAEDLMIEAFSYLFTRLTCIKRRGTWLCATKADSVFPSILTI